MQQEEGFLGRMVGSMIRRSVRTRFRNVYWKPPEVALKAPCVFYANHHGWHDGYLMYHLVTRLGIPSIDWIEEFDAFPLFAKVGGRPFPKGDPAGRSKVIRGTVEEMRQGRSLVLFAEGVLHRPPEVLPLSRILEFVQRSVEGLALVPVAITYEMALHERPEAWLSVGRPLVDEDPSEALRRQLNSLKGDIERGLPFEVLAKGTGDVNERWDMRRLKAR